MTDYPPPPAGYPAQPMPMGQPPSNNLVWGILVTIFCCLPLGIVSIVQAAQVNSKWAMGDYAGAQKAAEDAKKWAMWGAIAGVVGGIVYGVFIALGAAAGISTY